MRNAVRRASAATNAPEPWRVVTSPSARKAATASRTTVRLTRMACISFCSVGSLAPGVSLPLRISLAIRSTISSVRLRVGRRGRKKAGLSAGGDRTTLVIRLVIVQLL